MRCFLEVCWCTKRAIFHGASVGADFLPFLSEGSLNLAAMSAYFVCHLCR